jgi:hypothetical protein
MLLKKLAMQENVSKEWPGEANSRNKKVNYTNGEANLEKIKHEIVEVLMMLRLYL